MSPAVPPLPEPPDVFSFLRYADWLASAVENTLESDPYWTHRRLSQRCGFKSSGALSLIASGRRRASADSIRRIGRGFELRAAEVDHLVMCVEYERADSAGARATILQRMGRSERFVRAWEGSMKAFEFYETWYLPLLRETVSLVGPDAPESDIVHALHTRLTPAEVFAGLKQLAELGIIEPATDEGWRVCDVVLATNDEVASGALLAHQREMILRSVDALELPPESRNFRVATVCISHAQAAIIHQMVHRFIREVMNVVVEDEPLQAVYQLNMQWFPWTTEAGGPVSPTNESRGSLARRATVTGGAS